MFVQYVIIHKRTLKFMQKIINKKGALASFLLFLYIFWHSTLKDLPQTTSLTYFCIYRTCYRQLLLHAALVYKKCHIARHVSCYTLAIRHYLSNLQILSIFYLWLNSFGVYRCLGIPSTITGDTSPWINGRTYEINSFVT